eukprot:m.400342 g.400342  ORF g.400342 m.400342 type:complete len:53 (-) comp16783_c0_seq2:64-222(-)
MIRVWNLIPCKFLSNELKKSSLASAGRTSHKTEFLTCVPFQNFLDQALAFFH